MSLGLADNLSTRIVSATSTEKFDAASAIRIENSRGQVSIEAWDQPGIQVTIVKSTTRAFDPKQHDPATQLLDRAHIKPERNSDTLVISTEIPKHDKDAVQVDYVIQAPRATKIEVSHAEGALFVIGIAADIHAVVHHGQITLNLPAGDAFTIAAHARIGDVYSEFDGTDPRHKLGHNFTSTSDAGTAHKLALDVTVGDIVILKAVK
jgi:hypothetical protein